MHVYAFHNHIDSYAHLSNDNVLTVLVGMGNTNSNNSLDIEYKTSPHIFTFADAKCRHLPDYFQPLVLWAFRCLRGLRVHNRGSPKHRVMAKHKHTFDSQSWLTSETTRNLYNYIIQSRCLSLWLSRFVDRTDVMTLRYNRRTASQPSHVVRQNLQKRKLRVLNPARIHVFYWWYIPG